MIVDDESELRDPLWHQVDSPFELEDQMADLAGRGFGVLPARP